MKTKNKIVYKYRDWTDNYHQDILRKNHLYLASPKDFNDPFDCRISPNYSLLSAEEGSDYVKELAIKGFELSEKMGLNFETIFRDLEKRYSDTKTFQKFADDLLFNQQDESYAIFACALRWNNILMWSHYANRHQGFCVGFWSEKLLNSHLFGKLGEVVYANNYPDIKPRVAKMDDQMMYNSFLETHTKAKIWKYESEYRFMSNLFP
jgi:hypothetical protein